MEIISKIADRYCNKFRFGSFERDDIYQECVVLALEKLPKYDASRGSLENFLSVAIRRGVINIKRNKFVRQKDPPCITCPFYDPDMKKSRSGCAEFEDKQCCDLFARWSKSAQRQKDLAGTAKQSDSKHRTTASNEIVDKAELKELYELIKDNVPANLRADFLRLIDGVSMSQYRKDKIKNYVLEWLKEDNKDD